MYYGVPEPPEPDICEEMRGDCEHCPERVECEMPDLPELDLEEEERKVPIELLEGEYDG
jgi:hypothetical protein